MRCGTVVLGIRGLSTRYIDDAGREMCCMGMQDDLCKALEEQKDYQAWWNIPLIPYSCQISETVSNAKNAVHARHAFVTPRCISIPSSLSND